MTGFMHSNLSYHTINNPILLLYNKCREKEIVYFAIYREFSPSLTSMI